MFAIDHEGDHALDPGTELVDLADELALTDAEARSWLDVEPEVITADLGRLTGHAVDYEWAGWLTHELRSVGCSVVAYPGWKFRGRPRSVGPFTPRGLIWHHDGSPKGPSPSLARFIAEEGRPAEGIPAPLAQLWVCQGCNGRHPVGTWHVLAAGRANHAGIGDGWGAIGEDLGTSLTLGVETDNTTGEPTSRRMLDELVIGSAAIMRRLRSDPAEWLCGHKEYAPSRKIDPDDIDMDDARVGVSVEMLIQGASPKRWLREFPSADHFQLNHKCRSGHVERLESWLLELAANSKRKHEASPIFTRWTVDRVREFQLTDRMLRRSPDGKVNAETWRRLQLRVKAGL